MPFRHIKSPFYLGTHAQLPRPREGRGLWALNLFIAVVVLLAAQTALNFILWSAQQLNARVIARGVEGFLVKEAAYGDSYAMAKALAELSAVQFIKCPVLIKEIPDQQIMLDLRYRDKCETSLLLLDGAAISLKFRSLNGDEWRVSFLMKNNVEFSVLVWTARGLLAAVLILIFLIARIQLQRRERLMHTQVLYAETISQIATQVAHDIRSPLAALSVVEKELVELPEEKRTMIRGAINRIRDIANSLLDKNRELITKGQNLQPTEIAKSTEPRSAQLLSALLEPLVTEKRMQFRSKIGIEVEGVFGQDSYGLFADVQPTEFKRVVSNLINNSVEALKDRGSVKIILEGNEHDLRILVKDNGKGIPASLIPKLMQKGETHGKASGHGLGLHHARTTIEAWGGGVAIVSTEGQGTTVTISLPRAKSPDWFVAELKLHARDTVVIVDDDASIHQVWRGRFDSVRAKDHGIEIVHSSMPENVAEWVSANPEKKETALFLVDYEFLGSTTNGIDIIERNSLQKRSILVTSRFEEPAIRERCARLGVPLIPKGLAGFVPVSVAAGAGLAVQPSAPIQPSAPVQTSTAMQSSAAAQAQPLASLQAAVPGQPSVPTEEVDAILVDDDILIHVAWKHTARAVGKKLVCFASPAAFEKVMHQYAKSTTIYIDSTLDDDVKGEEWAKTLFEKGFQNLYLATGYSAESFPAMPWIKGIIGKDSPWSD